MSMWLTLLLFLVGIVLIVKGGDVFVDAASWIAEISGIPKFIVGATIVSVATTLPEMIVSIMAAAEGKTDMAVGNAVGSVTANTALILALALIFMTVVVKRRDYLLKACLLIGSTVILWVGSLTGSLALWASIALGVIFVVFVWENIREGKRGATAAEDRPKYTRKELGIKILQFVLGAAGIVIGSRLLVNSGSTIAEYMGVPERVIAITMIAIGTSLPELVTTLTAIVKKQSSLSVGNIIGANIIDMTLILPICSIVSGQQLPIAPASISLDLPACCIVTLVAMLPMLWKERFTKIQGVVLLCMYAVYLIIAM